MAATAEATQRISAAVYEKHRRLTLRAIGLTEKDIDKLHGKVADALKKSLKGLKGHSNREIEAALRSHYGLEFKQARQALVAEGIGLAAKSGAAAGVEVFKRIYGDDDPLPEKSSSGPMRHLRLLPRLESAAR